MLSLNLRMQNSKNDEKNSKTHVPYIPAITSAVMPPSDHPKIENCSWPNDSMKSLATWASLMKKFSGKVLSGGLDFPYPGGSQAYGNETSSETMDFRVGQLKLHLTESRIHIVTSSSSHLVKILLNEFFV